MVPNKIELLAQEFSQKLANDLEKGVINAEEATRLIFDFLKIHQNV